MFLKNIVDVFLKYCLYSLKTLCPLPGATYEWWYVNVYTPYRQFLFFYVCKGSTYFKILCSEYRILIIF